MNIETLKILDRINLNNQIVQLEYDLKQHEKQNEQFYIKSKQMLSELIKNNDILISEKNDLSVQLDTLKKQNDDLNTIINKIPKFLLKFLIKKNKILLLDKGLNYESKFEKTKNK